jgi:hypothetical protein
VSADSTVLVAFAGVLGTLGAALATAWTAMHNKRVDAEMQIRRQQSADKAQLESKDLDAKIRQCEREDERKVAANADKRATYVQLNAAARDYRAAGHSYLMDRLGRIKPEGSGKVEQQSQRDLDNLEQIERAREKYREVYSRAQMICPEDVFKLASEVNDCFGHAYRTIRDLSENKDCSVTVKMLHDFYDKELNEGVKQLRCVLREDIGVKARETDADSAVQTLKSARLSLWPEESTPAYSPADDI